MNWNEVLKSPLFGVTATVTAYALAMAVYRKHPKVHPLLTSCGLLIALLLLARIPYDQYKIGGDYITFFLGPTTVALGVPFFKQARRIGRALPAIAIAVMAGSTAGVLAAGLLVKLAHGSDEVFRSMLPKSVTSPIAIELSKQIGGNAELTVAFAMMAGILGSVIGPRALRWCGVRHDIAIGAAVGTSAHGIGTARLVRDSELQGGVSALSMALAGIFTSILMVPVQWWLAR